MNWSGLSITHDHFRLLLSYLRGNYRTPKNQKWLQGNYKSKLQFYSKSLFRFFVGLNKLKLIMHIFSCKIAVFIVHWSIFSRKKDDNGTHVLPVVFLCVFKFQDEYNCRCSEFSFWELFDTVQMIWFEIRLWQNLEASLQKK